MKSLKSFLFLCLGIGVGLALNTLFHDYIRIPILPAVIIPWIAYLIVGIGCSGQSGSAEPILVAAWVSFDGLWQYANDVYLSIAEYPLHSSVWGIILGCITILIYLPHVIRGIVLILGMIVECFRQKSDDLSQSDPVAANMPMAERDEIPTAHKNGWSALATEWRFSLLAAAVLVTYLSVLAFLARAEFLYYALVVVWNIIMVFGYVFLPIALARRHKSKGGGNPLIVAVCAIGVAFFVHMILLMLGGNVINFPAILAPVVLSLIGIWGGRSVARAAPTAATDKNELPRSVKQPVAQDDIEARGKAIGTFVTITSEAVSESYYTRMKYCSYSDDPVPELLSYDECRRACISCLSAVVYHMYSRLGELKLAEEIRFYTFSYYLLHELNLTGDAEKKRLGDELFKGLYVGYLKYYEILSAEMEPEAFFKSIGLLLFRSTHNAEPDFSSYDIDAYIEDTAEDLISWQESFLSSLPQVEETVRNKSVPA